MRLVRLFLATRVRGSILAALGVLTVSTLLLGRSSWIPATFDRSAVIAMITPGLATALVFTLAVTSLPHIESASRLRVTSLTVGILVPSLCAATAVSLAAMPERDFFNTFGPSEVIRNHLFFALIGLLCLVLDVAAVSPYITAGSTIVVAGMFGITRSDALWLLPATTESATGTTLALVALCLVAISVVFRKTRMVPPPDTLGTRLLNGVNT